MKKTLNIIVILALAALAAMACQDIEPVNPYKVDPKISVVKSDVLFPVRASQGTIEVKAEGSYTATCSSSWVTLSTSGNTVNVSVTANESVSGRSATVLLTCGGSTVKVCVQQLGIVFNNETVSPEGGSFNADITGIGNYTVECDANWISWEQSGNDLVVTAAKNRKPADRSTKLVIKTETSDITYIIAQGWVFSLEGNYKLKYFTGSSESTTKEDDVTLTMDGNDRSKYILTGLYGYSIPITADQTTGEVVIKNCTYLGQVEDLYHYLCVNYSNNAQSSNYYSVSTNANYDVYFTFEWSDDADGYVFTLKDSAKAFNSDRLSQGFAIYSFTTGPDVALATGNRKAVLYTIRKPSITPVP